MLSTVLKVICLGYLAQKTKTYVVMSCCLHHWAYYYQNMRGLQTKTDQLIVNMCDCDFDILALSETWLNLKDQFKVSQVWSNFLAESIDEPIAVDKLPSIDLVGVKCNFSVVVVIFCVYILLSRITRSFLTPCLRFVWLFWVSSSAILTWQIQFWMVSMYFTTSLVFLGRATVCIANSCNNILDLVLTHIPENLRLNLLQK